MIGKKAEEILNQSVKLAFDYLHEYFTLEHVFYCLLEDEDVLVTLENCGAHPDEIKKDLKEYLKKEIPESTEHENLHPVATLSVQRLIQRALFHVQSSGKMEISPVDLLAAFFQAKDSYSLYLLQAQGVEKLDVLNYISHGVIKDQSEEEAQAHVLEGEEEKKTKKRATFLDKYTLNLNQRVMDQKIDPLIGREKEIERALQVLGRRKKNNPLFVGEAGVGKTALAEGIAYRIVEGKIPNYLENTVVYSLDLGSMLAGAKYRGDFEERMKGVIRELKEKKNLEEDPILFIDEIHTVIGAGSVSGGAMDAANMLKPLLTQGDLQVIGSTTYQEFRSVFEKDHAMARRFQKIDVKEPSPDETIQILQGLKSKYEKHHGVKYTDRSIQAMVELSTRHLHDKFLPDKAIDLMDEVGARARLQRIEKRDDESKVVTISEKEIEKVISMMAQIPERSVNSNQKDQLKNLDRNLKLAIFGQDEAVEAVVAAIRLSRSGLRSGEKPVGSFLFCGPTGVGKTELTKQLAKLLSCTMVRLDMSEYMEKHSVSRLIGAPPGYVGYDQAGILSDQVLKHPYSVVLFDEMEKAHPEVWNILLQVMDHGFLTDSQGRKIDFRNSVLIMTSNVGSQEMMRRSLGLSSDSSLETSEAKKAIERTFTPEFRNRLDAIVYFNPLQMEQIAQVVQKHLSELDLSLSSKNVELEVSEEVKEWIAKKGYDPKMGARPIARMIEDQMKRPLANEILFGKLEKGGKVLAKLENDKLQFEFFPLKKKSDTKSKSKSKLKA